MTTCIRRPHSYWSTCPCDDCRRDRKRKQKMLSVGIRYRVPEEVAWQILAEKIDAGWTARALGSAMGLDADYFSRHVARHRRGERVLLGPVIAAKIVTMGRPTEGQIGAEPTRRRLRALAAIGHGLNTLSAETGVPFSTLAMARSENERVGAALANKIADTYTRLHMTPGHDDQALRMAREKGWAAPLAWDDIDDLDEVHEPAPQPRDWQRFKEGRAAELAELDEHHAGITEACKRLKVSRQAIAKWCERHDMTPLYSRLIEREQPRYWRNGGAEGGAA